MMRALWERDPRSIAFPLGRPEYKADPFRHYERLRDSNPVARVRLPDRRTAWLVIGYSNVLEGLREPRLVKDPSNVLAGRARAPWMPSFLRPLTKNMLDMDGADHRRLRDLVQPAFTPARITELNDRVQSLVDSLLDAVHRQGRMDVVRDFALPIPATIIAELLGAPVGDYPKFHRWSNAMVGADTSVVGRFVAIPPVVSFLRYMRRLVRRRRQAPRDDLLSILVGFERQGDRLSEDELVGMAFLLLVAGHETTVHLISLGVLALLDNPGEARRLAEGIVPGTEASDELARFTSPVELATERYAAESLSLGGVVIPAGDLVLLCLASANHDPSVFEEPDQLRLDRRPNRHLAFGRGIHFCLGAPLARLEAGLALATLFRRLPNLRLDVEPANLRWRSSLMLRGLHSLPVRW